jgi:hypothetical protein
MTIETPRVTLGLPAYNEERTLELTVGSLLDQSFEDFELVLADNASTDGTLALMRRLEAQDGRIRVLTSDRNLGAIGNFRRLLEAARGEFFAWVGAHDAYDRDWLARLAGALDADPRLAMVYPLTRKHLDDGTLLSDSLLTFDSRGLTAVQRAHRAAELTGAGERIYGLYRTAMARAYPIRTALRWDTLYLAGLALVGDVAPVPEAVWYRSYHERPVASTRHTAQTLSRQLRVVFPEDAPAPLIHHLPALYHQGAMLRDGLRACRACGHGWAESLSMVGGAMAGLRTRSSLRLELAMLLGLVGGKAGREGAYDEDMEYAL